MTTAQYLTADDVRPRREARDQLQQQAQDKLAAWVAENGLSNRYSAPLYGGPDRPVCWLQVYVNSTADAIAWAKALGTTPTAHASFNDDDTLHVGVTIAEGVTVLGVPVPVDVNYYPAAIR